MLSHLLTAIVIGLSAAAPIGPVNLEIMRRGLRGGFQPAFFTGVGAASVDAVYCSLFILGFGTLATPGVTSVLSPLGAMVLLVLGALTLREALLQGQTSGPTHHLEVAGRDAFTDRVVKPRPHSRRGSYAVGLTMTALNPMTLAFWASVGAAIDRLQLVSTGERFLFAGGVIFGAMSWVVFFSIFLHRTRHRLSQRVQRWVTASGGLILLAFGIRLLW